MPPQLRGASFSSFHPGVSSSSPAISLESVSKRYGPKTIIHNLSFKVGEGEIVGFLGPNGAGKTTTMRMIAGYTAATSGRVSVAGYDMATANAEAARQIGPMGSSISPATEPSTNR